MTNMLCESAFFGVVISLLAYELGTQIWVTCPGKKFSGMQNCRR